MGAQERVRAWFLIDAAEVEAIKGKIRELDSGDEIVVVRVDEVDGGCFNLVAPVDVSSKEHLEYIDSNLRNDRRVRTHRLLTVTKHEFQDQGKPPHLAEGYISLDEFKADTQHKVEGEVDGKPYFTVTVSSGRQVHSPGFTPWG